MPRDFVTRTSSMLPRVMKRRWVKSRTAFNELVRREQAMLIIFLDNL